MQVSSEYLYQRMGDLQICHNNYRKHWQLMLQVCNLDGNTDGSNLHTVIKVMTDGYELTGKITANYVWCKTQKDCPKNFIPAQAKNYNDRWIEWLASQKIYDW